MYGAMLGDIIGAPYEFCGGHKSKEFPLFSEKSDFTDDTVMTFAIFNGLISAAYEGEDEKAISKNLVKACKKWGNEFPEAGYGGHFIQWLASKNPEPYNSYGNGSAMRVSSVGWMLEGLEETREIARMTAEISHNHPEGIKGAESVAAAIWLAREGHTKAEIKDYVEREFGYDLDRTCDEIRPDYIFDVSCQGSVPESIIAFLEAEDFEDAVRNAVSLGGDSDTQAAIAGSIAEAYFGIPDELIEKCRSYMTEEMEDLMSIFEKIRIPRKERK